MPETVDVIALGMGPTGEVALAIRVEVPIEVLLDGVAQFPTCSEGFLTALDQVR
ncbi:MAG TPA: hypothetical protein VF486_11675 [Actinomycetes bacterium]